MITGSDFCWGLKSEIDLKQLMEKVSSAFTYELQSPLSQNNKQYQMRVRLLSLLKTFAYEMNLYFFRTLTKKKRS